MGVVHGMPISIFDMKIESGSLKQPYQSVGFVHRSGTNF